MYEYHVMPAPKRGKKARGVKGAEGRFANAIQELLNEAAAEGWEYMRTDTLPSEERSGFRARATVYQNLLVFRRAMVVADTEAAVEPVYEEVAPVTAAPVETHVAETAETYTQEHYAPDLPSAEDANATAQYAPRIEHNS